MELTMSNLASAKWCDGSAVARTFRAPVLLKNFAFVKTLAPFQVLPLDSVAFVRRGSVSNSSSSKVAGGVQPSSHYQFSSIRSCGSGTRGSAVRSSWSA